MRRACAVALALALGMSVAASARAEVSRGTRFALPIALLDRADEVLAQRVIDRTWGPSDDSNYVEVTIPEWRSEGTALALSAVVPGTGQLYAGERNGLFFVAGEALGWFEWWYNRHRGRKIGDEARAYAGNPNDSLSHWSFETYQQRTGYSTDDLRRLYETDRTAFYYLIGRDDQYQQGWDDYSLGYNAISRQRYLEIHQDSEVHFKRARYFQAAIWVHHLVAAVDAMRSARLHNLELSPAVKLGVKTGWSHGGPSLAASIETRF